VGGRYKTGSFAPKQVKRRICRFHILFSRAKRKRKERLLNEILQHSEAGPQLLALAETMSDVDTK
jgi:hypothetical protein